LNLLRRWAKNPKNPAITSPGNQTKASKLEAELSAVRPEAACDVAEQGTENGNAERLKFVEVQERCNRLRGAVRLIEN
jgi:hypothetical protein